MLIIEELGQDRFPVLQRITYTALKDKFKSTVHHDFVTLIGFLSDHKDFCDTRVHIKFPEYEKVYAFDWICAGGSTLQDINLETGHSFSEDRLVLYNLEYHVTPSITPGLAPFSYSYEEKIKFGFLLFDVIRLNRFNREIYSMMNLPYSVLLNLDLYMKPKLEVKDTLEFMTYYDHFEPYSVRKLDHFFNGLNVTFDCWGSSIDLFSFSHDSNFNALDIITPKMFYYDFENVFSGLFDNDEEVKTPRILVLNLKDPMDLFRMKDILNNVIDSKKIQDCLQEKFDFHFILTNNLIDNYNSNHNFFLKCIVEFGKCLDADSLIMIKHDIVKMPNLKLL